MTRVLHVAAALILLTAPAMAQGQPDKDAGLTPEHVVARLMSFDRDGDGQIAASELIERLHPLLARADTNGNDALDASEVRAAVTAPSAPQVQLFFTGGYGFADEMEFSSRSHIEGALDDLRLAAPARDRARTIALAYADMIDAEARAELMASLAPVLGAGARAALERQLDPGTVQRSVNLVARSDARAVVSRFLFGSDPLVRTLDLETALQERATVALERFRARLRLTEADRTDLAGHLSWLLGADERMDLLAALARRPVVQASLLGR